MPGDHVTRVTRHALEGLKLDNSLHVVYTAHVQLNRERYARNDAKHKRASARSASWFLAGFRNGRDRATIAGFVRREETEYWGIYLPSVQYVDCTERDKSAGGGSGSSKTVGPLHLRVALA